MKLTAGVRASLAGVVHARPAIEIENCCENVNEFESLTVIVKVKPPVVVGVPEITPVAGSKLKPSGKLPEVIDHVNGVVPPNASSIWLYDVPTVVFDKGTMAMPNTEMDIPLVAAAPFASTT